MQPEPCLSAFQRPFIADRDKRLAEETKAAKDIPQRPARHMSPVETGRGPQTKRGTVSGPSK